MNKYELYNIPNLCKYILKMMVFSAKFFKFRRMNHVSKEPNSKQMNRKNSTFHLTRERKCDVIQEKLK